MAEAAVLRSDGLLVAAGLGSCVALIVYDAVSRVGGMAHILLPHEALSRARGGPARYATTAPAFLLDEMRGMARLVAPVATLVGGASMFGPLLKGGGINMGERNVIATRRALHAAGLPIAAEDVGGEFGRSVYFDVATGQVRVATVRSGERVL